MNSDIYSAQFVKTLFNQMSKSYERMNYITSFGFSLRWRKQFITSLPTSGHNIEIIDLLTGMGESWDAIFSQYPNCHLTALDFSEEMLKYAESKNEKYYNKKINIIKSDILNNTIPDNSYDIVTCSFGLKTFNENQLRVLAAETNRILKAGGCFSFVEVSSPSNTILKGLYSFYLGSIIPILGRIFLGNPNDYKMLWQYTAAFGNCKRAVEIFKQEGLQAEYSSFFYGCASGVYGSKQLNEAKSCK